MSSLECLGFMFERVESKLGKLVNLSLLVLHCWLCSLEPWYQQATLYGSLQTEKGDVGPRGAHALTVRASQDVNVTYRCGCCSLRCWLLFLCHAWATAAQTFFVCCWEVAQTHVTAMASVLYGPKVKRMRMAGTYWYGWPRLRQFIAVEQLRAKRRSKTQQRAQRSGSSKEMQLRKEVAQRRASSKKWGLREKSPGWR